MSLKYKNKTKDEQLHAYFENTTDGQNGQTDKTDGRTDRQVGRIQRDLTHRTLKTKITQLHQIYELFRGN